MILSHPPNAVTRGRMELDFGSPALSEPGMVAVALGEQPDGPMALLVCSPPNLEWAAHHHDTETITIVIEGSVRVGTRWYGPGSVRIQERGSVYGPGMTGPDGAKTIVFFADRRGLPDEYVREADRVAYAHLPARSKELLELLGAAARRSPDTDRAS